MTSRSRSTRSVPTATLAALLALLSLAACGDDGNDPPANLSDEYRSHCDQHGNRVYITEDDNSATPGLFVVQGDCDG